MLMGIYGGLYRAWSELFSLSPQFWFLRSVDWLKASNHSWRRPCPWPECLSSACTLLQSLAAWLHAAPQRGEMVGECCSCSSVRDKLIIRRVWRQKLWRGHWRRQRGLEAVQLLRKARVHDSLLPTSVLGAGTRERGAGDSQTLIMVSTSCSRSVWLLSTSLLTFPLRHFDNLSQISRCLLPELVLAPFCGSVSLTPFSQPSVFTD